MSLVEGLSFSTVRSRLIAHLPRLAEETGRQTPRGIQFELAEITKNLTLDSERLGNSSLET